MLTLNIVVEELTVCRDPVLHETRMKRDVYSGKRRHCPATGQVLYAQRGLWDRAHDLRDGLAEGCVVVGVKLVLGVEETSQA